MKRILLPLLATGFCLMTPLSQAASDYLLEIDGIKGESSDAARPATIEISSFSWGMSNSKAITGGAGAGKATFKEFTITKKTDKATPKLMLSCATGQHIKSAKLFVRKSGGGGDEYLVITLTDILVSSYSVSGSSASGDSVPTDQISFTVAALSVDYTAADGSVHSESVRPTPDDGGVVGN